MDTYLQTCREAKEARAPILRINPLDYGFPSSHIDPRTGFPEEAASACVNARVYIMISPQRNTNASSLPPVGRHSFPFSAGKKSDIFSEFDPRMT